MLTVVGIGCFAALTSPEQVLYLRLLRGRELLGMTMAQIGFTVGGAAGASCSGMILEAGHDFHYPALMGVVFALAGCLVSLVFSRKGNGYAETDKLRSAKAWLPVFALTLAAFIINTSEFIPIGLLTDIASEFHITEAEAGVMISSYAWVVALLSLPLMMAVVKMDYRRLLLWTLGVFIACSVLSALSPGYIVLLAARMGVACSHCIFWGVAAALAVKVAPEGKRAVALGMIVTGTSIAMIIGLPLGRTIGLYMTWRMTFVSIAVTALLIALFLGMVFPKLPNTRPMTLHRLPVLFRNKALMSIYVFTLLTTTAHYTGYSYVEPFLAQVARLDEISSRWF